MVQESSQGRQEDSPIMKTLITFAALLIATPSYACGPAVTKTDCAMLKNSERLIAQKKAYYVTHEGQSVEVLPETLKALRLKNGANVDINTFYRAMSLNMDAAVVRLQARRR